MLVVYKNLFRNLDRNEVVYEYSRNDYTIKIINKSNHNVEDEKYHNINFKIFKNNKETVITLYDDDKEKRKAGLFISSYCYRLVKGKKIFEIQHPEHYCNKFGIYTLGSIIDSATDTKGMRKIFVLTENGWKGYDKPDAIIEYPELEGVYNVEVLI